MSTSTVPARRGRDARGRATERGRRTARSERGTDRADRGRTGERRSRSTSPARRDTVGSDQDEQEPTGRRRWPIALAAALVALTLAAGAWVIWFSSVLAVRTVQVTGVDSMVSGAVGLSLTAYEGTPMARVDLDQARDRVLALPDVADAEVTRQWPNTLVASVRPRTPVAVTAANGAMWLMDSSGTVYRQVETVPTDLVTVALATPGPDDPATEAALTVLGALTAEFREQVEVITARSAFAVSVTLKDGREVVWGGTDRSLRKMQILPALLQQPGDVFDLSDPDLVTVR